MWQRGQHLSLEGDFDRYFRLYCPAGYERDALYLFTPDVMARFIRQHAAVLEVEIVDDWLFLYSREELSTLDPARWAWVFSVIAALTGQARTVGTVARRPARGRRRRSCRVGSGRRPGGRRGGRAPWRLPRMPRARRHPESSAGVAPPGRRLRRGGVWTIVAIVVGTIVLALGFAALVFGPILLLFAR